MPIKNNSILVAYEFLEDPTISKLSVIAAKTSGLLMTHKV